MFEPLAERPAGELAEGVTNGLAELAATLRAQGSRVGMGELLTAHQALEAVDCTSREDARLALRAVLCSDRGDLAKFDLAFLAVYGSGAPLGHSPFDELGGIEREVLPHAGLATGGPPPPRSEGGELTPVPSAWSDVELLRHKDFATYTDAEMALARLLIAQLARRGPTRLSRRTRPSRRRGHAPDLRRVVRASLRTAGEPVDRYWRAPSRRPRPVVLVCDVSGSMTPYARMLLQYLHASVAARRRVEAFAFGTRLTRVTHELGGRDHDRALERAAEAVTDFSGGTRIGDALATLNRDHGRRVGRGAVVVILSDGWDRGDPERLQVEMARLRRSAHRLVWLNPLAAHPEFAPLTRGMRAAIPHMDELLAGNSLASLEQLAVILEEI
ncbi:MAG TPA: VWA domain-containing protein [Solirubrobacteraceae bacterium]